MERSVVLKMGILLLSSCSVLNVYSYWYIPQGKGKAVRLDEERWRGKLVYYRVNPDGSKSYSDQPFPAEKIQKRGAVLASLAKRVQGHLARARKK